MEDDDDGRKSRRRSCGGHCEQARRLMRVSTIPNPNNFQSGDDDDDSPRTYLPRNELSNTKKKEKTKNEKSNEKDPCDDEYMLQNLHKLKRFLRRVWNYAWCYTQYCYPGLRTAEYYKKVKRACQEKEKAKKNEKKDKKKNDKAKAKTKEDKKKDEKKKMENRTSLADPVLLSAAPTGSAFLSDNSTQTDESDWSDLDGSDDDEDKSDSRRRPRRNHLKHLVKPLKILPEYEEELGWGQLAVKRCREISQWLSNFIEETDKEYQIGATLKVICLLLAPAVMWLGINYLLLKRKYKTLSGKLRRIKEENEILKKESGKLETMLVSSENLKMPFSSKESRQQVVAEFTRLAESRMKSKKEINRLTTEKQALMEELKMAKKQRDAARNQYSSLTQGISENNHSPYVQS